MNQFARQQFEKLRAHRLQSLLQPECINRRLLREKMNYCWDILQRPRMTQGRAARPAGPDPGTA